MSEARSKFAVTLDSSADAVNRQPNLKGEFRLAGEEAATTLALWGGKSEKTGKFYARGKATAASVLEAIAATANDSAPTPPGIDLKVGEAVLFANDKATADNKQPHVYGYARRANGFVRLAGWDRGGSITGTAEPYRPKQGDADIAAPAHTKG